MKGKQLTLEEVLNLEDGSKVWVEDNRKNFNNCKCVYQKSFLHLKDLESKSHYDLNLMESYGRNLTFYEWVEDYIITDLIINLAQEICNLRGLDLTDENIRLIIEEFMEEK